MNFPKAVEYNAVDIARWFIENNAFLSYDRFGNKENHLKLEKMLHYANVIMHLLYDAPLFKENVVAYTEGFVVEEFYNEFRHNPLDVYQKPLRKDFDERENKVLNLTNILFGRLTGYELSNTVHLDDIWDNYEKDSCNHDNHKTLSQEDILKFYSNQNNFKENLQFIIENYSKEKAFIDNIIVEKLYDNDNVFFYYTKDLNLTKEDKQVMKCLSEEHDSDAETKYYYLYKNQDGVLNIE